MEPILYVAMVLGIAAVLASMISVELGISVAVIGILAGVGLGNTLHLATQDWLVFLASFGSVVLTFNAGAEIDPAQLRRSWRASLLIGSASFAAPFTVVCCCAATRSAGPGRPPKAGASPCPAPRSRSSGPSLSRPDWPAPSSVSC